MSTSGVCRFVAQARPSDSEKYARLVKELNIGAN